MSSLIITNRLCLLLSVLAIVFITFAPCEVSSFGHDGHQIVANIANSRISKNTALVVNDVLDGESLEDVANWADEVTKEKDWTASLHFINVQQDPCDKSVECEVVYRRDCVSNICVAGAILNYTAIEEQLTNPGLLNTTAANEALKYVIHFVGDVHQPLHVARDSDRGGVITDVHFYVPGQGSDWNLHNVWDFGLIVRSINETFNGRQDLFTADLNNRIATEWNEEVNDWLQCTITSSAEMTEQTEQTEQTEKVVSIKNASDIKLCVVQWGQESLEQATSQAYINENGVEIQEGDYISDEYYASRLPVLQKRLAMAGVRLAGLLDRLFDSLEL